MLCSERTARAQLSCVHTDTHPHTHGRSEEYVPVRKRRAMEEAKLRQLRGVSCQRGTDGT